MAWSVVRLSSAVDSSSLDGVESELTISSTPGVTMSSKIPSAPACNSFRRFRMARPACTSRKSLTPSSFQSKSVRAVSALLA